MTATFAILAILTVASALAAMSLRNLVHCALALTVTFAGLAAFYLQLDAQFVGFAQILVYIGAVAILIVFAILLTRGGDESSRGVFSSSWAGGLVVAVIVFAILTKTILSRSVQKSSPPPPPQATVHQIGDLLMTKYILPLEVVGLLITAALIGAVIIDLKEKEGR